jgi:DNA-directed RNA polymerase I, II, and III subunit RPABC1
MTQREQNVKKILIEMFQQRGYENIEEKEDMLIATDIVEGKAEQVCGFFIPVPKLNTAEIRTKISILGEMEILHGILVYEGVPNSAVNNVVSTATAMNMNIEIFHADDLQYNPTKHFLVPKHEALPAKEGKAFRDTYGAQKIPILLRTDPICRFFDFRKGSIIKITRKGGHVCFRIVR